MLVTGDWARVCAGVSAPAAPAHPPTWAGGRRAAQGPRAKHRSWGHPARQASCWTHPPAAPSGLCALLQARAAAFPVRRTGWAFRTWGSAQAWKAVRGGISPWSPGLGAPLAAMPAGGALNLGPTVYLTFYLFTREMRREAEMWAEGEQVPHGDPTRDSIWALGHGLGRGRPPCKPLRPGLYTKGTLQREPHPGPGTPPPDPGH